MKGAVSLKTLTEVGFWAPKRSKAWPRRTYTGLIPLPTSNHHGIRKGRTARRVRRCLRRQDQRWVAQVKASVCVAFEQ